MRTAIIGTGNVGLALAAALTRAGHAVTLGTRDPARAVDKAPGLALARPADAARDAEIVVLAVPWAALPDTLALLGDLTGQTVIDCTNPLGRTDAGLGLTLGHTTSGGERVAGWLPQAHVVKTLNQVGAEVMADARRLPHPPAMFMAGNDAGAKAAVAGMLADIGFDPLDAGDITRSRLLEPLGMVWINQSILRGKGRAWALAALPLASVG